MLDYEEPAVINRRLKDEFGLFEDGRPNYRIVYAPDEIERRWAVTQKKDIHGNILNTTEGVQLVKKYPHIANKWVLEVLIGIPDFIETDMVEKTSYEVIWTFESPDGSRPLPPNYVACKFIIQQRLFAMSQVGSGPKYAMPELEKQTPEAIEARIKLLREALYGEESSVGDALARGEAVGFTTEKELKES